MAAEASVTPRGDFHSPQSAGGWLKAVVLIEAVADGYLAFGEDETDCDRAAGQVAAGPFENVNGLQ
jgi:hypothetical protein